MTDFDHVSINEFLDHLRREPNPDDVLDWVDARLHDTTWDIHELQDAIIDALGMIEAYRDARNALA
jgi:hypothetical protein